VGYLSGVHPACVEPDIDRRADERFYPSASN
jgi:hypothetical protein